MQATVQERLDSRIRALETKLDQLRTMRAVLDDSDLAAEMKELFSVVEEVAPPGGKPLSASMQKVVAFFRERANQPADLFAIEESTGITRNSIRQIVYQSNVDAFEREGHRGGGQRSLFWLKNGVTDKK